MAGDRVPDGRVASEQLDRDVRLAVYRQLIEGGGRPALSDLVSATGLGEADVRAALDRLHERHELVLDEETRAVLMAMPFSAVPTGYRVYTPKGMWYGNCAWDALGIAAALHTTARVEARCDDCGEALTLVVREDGLESGTEVVHFAVPAAKWWEDIGFT